MSATAKIGTPFTVTPVWIVESPTLSRDAKFLFSVLWRYSDNSTRQCCVARATLAEACNVKSLRTIDTWIAELVDIGAVEKVTGGGRKSSIYKLKTSQDCTSANGCTRAVDCTAPVQEFAPHPCTELQGTRAASCTAPVQPAAPVLETAKKLPETTLSPLPLSKPKSGESDLEAESKSQSDLEAFDTSLPVEPPPAQTIRPKPQPIRPASRLAPQPIDPDEQKLNLLTSAVFSAFVLTSKSPALTGRWQNPTFDQRDRVMLALKPWASDETLTVKSIHALVKFASKDEFWRSRAHKPDSFVKNLESLIVAFNHALEAQSA